MKKQLGTVLFSNLTKFPEFQGKPTGKYELTILLDEVQVADAEESGLQVSKKEYQGNDQFSAKFKTKFQLNGKKVVDKYKEPYVDSNKDLKEIPKGSRVVVFYTQRPYTMMGREGMTNDLRGILVLEEEVGIDFDEYAVDPNEEVDKHGEDLEF